MALDENYIISELKQFIAEDNRALELRLEAKLEAKLEEKLEAKLDAKLISFEQKLDAKLDAKLGALEAKITQKIDDLSASVAEAIDASNDAHDELLKDHERRITKLEHVAA